ncbi:uncharacterized protein RCO7_04414 [Rhynchosporium graminicola]|uniref:Uncharacterized protein n=1 Tax=Rhynchosporium graminicola TaxID=2792576 RepID=A0A1E1JRP5_9HELO|nr:uncharacterized protein RCO7_04414 [Rhynchosporium commune]
MPHDFETTAASYRTIRKRCRPRTYWKNEQLVLSIEKDESPSMKLTLIPSARSSRGPLSTQTRTTTERGQERPLKRALRDGDVEAQAEKKRRMILEGHTLREDEIKKQVLVIDLCTDDEEESSIEVLEGTTNIEGSEDSIDVSTTSATQEAPISTIDFFGLDPHPGASMDPDHVFHTTKSGGALTIIDPITIASISPVIPEALSESVEMIALQRIPESRSNSREDSTHSVRFQQRHNRHADFLRYCFSIFGRSWRFGTEVLFDVLGC